LTDEGKAAEQAALDFVMAKNLRRRHLTAGQRSMIAAELANMSVGGDRKSDQRTNSSNDRVSTERAAKTMGVGTTSVKEAKKLMKENPTAAADVKAGKKSLAKASGASAKAAQKKEQLEKAFVRIEKMCGKSLADAVRAKRRLKKPRLPLVS
jgi:Zn-dependent alcohol dehydrogenase